MQWASRDAIVRDHVHNYKVKAVCASHSLGYSVVISQHTQDEDLHVIRLQAPQMLDNLYMACKGGAELVADLQEDDTRDVGVAWRLGHAVRVVCRMQDSRALQYLGLYRIRHLTCFPSCLLLYELHRVDEIPAPWTGNGCAYTQLMGLLQGQLTGAQLDDARLPVAAYVQWLQEDPHHCQDASAEALARWLPRVLKYLALCGVVGLERWTSCATPVSVKKLLPLGRRIAHDTNHAANWRILMADREACGSLVALRVAVRGQFCKGAPSSHGRQDLRLCHHTDDLRCGAQLLQEKACDCCLGELFCLVRHTALLAALRWLGLPAFRYVLVHFHAPRIGN